jgi:hypothetical protein
MRKNLLFVTALAGWYCMRTISEAAKKTCGSFVIER